MQVKLKPVRAVRRLLLTFGYQIKRTNTLQTLKTLLGHLIAINGSVTFVQIGANDGRMQDPLYWFIQANRPKVKGICVEPLKDVFQSLVHNYRNCPEITPVNVAIHNTAKEIDLFRVDPSKLPDLPEFAQGIASVNPEHHKLSKVKSDAIITERVKCLSLVELLDHYDIRHLDLLQIDTEGYDAEIVRGIDFNLIHPPIIRFEHWVSLGIMTRKELKSVLNFLHNHGYLTMIDTSDALAYEPSMLDVVLYK